MSQINNSQLSQYLDRSGNASYSKIYAGSSKGQYNDSDSNDEIEKLKRILKKPIPARTPQNREFILNFIEESPILTQMSNILSLDFVKNFLNHGLVVQFEKGQCIGSENDKISIMGIILKGKVNVYDKEYEDLPIIDRENYWQNLIIEAQKMVMKDSSDMETSSCQLRLNPQIYEENPKQMSYSLYTDETVGFLDRSVGQIYLSSFVAQQNSILFIITQNSLLHLIYDAMKTKLKALYGRLTRLSYFNFLQQEQLNAIIRIMTMKKAKKDQLIYKQGDKSNKIYILESGEVKHIKNICLQKQDPNELYMNRSQLLQEQFAKKGKSVTRHDILLMNKLVKKESLPYADLHNMYNFIPTCKDVLIGTISNFCLFGEEEVLGGKNREASALCGSLVCKYYEVEVPRLFAILDYKRKEFTSLLEESSRAKVLARQKNLSKTLTIENRNHLDYFYIQNDKHKVSPRKLRLQKFNNRLRDNQQSRQMAVSEHKSSKGKVKPAYNTFNFEKILKSPRKKSKKQKPPPPIQLPSPSERSIMQTTHTWSLIKERVNAQNRTFHKINFRKQRITFKHPLFQKQYISMMQKQKKRVQLLEKRSRSPHKTINTGTLQ